MFKHILVPTDLTDKSLTALDIAVKMARGEKGMVTLLHVIETIDNAEYREFEDFYETLKSRAHRKMEEIAASHGARGVRIEVAIALGKRVEEIVRFAESHGPDLIALSSHKVERQGGARGFGTISYKVGLLAPCPVMMVK